MTFCDFPEQQCWEPNFLTLARGEGAILPIRLSKTVGGMIMSRATPRDCGYQSIEVRRGTRVAFPRSPRRKIFVVSGRIRPRLDLVADDVGRDDGYRVPNAGLHVDTYRIAPENVRGSDPSSVIEREEGKLAVKNQEGFGLGRIAVPMRRDVRTTHHHIQEPMRVVLHSRVEVVVRPQSRTLTRALNKRPNQFQVQ
jgi:hypothetical protein